MASGIEGDRLASTLSLSSPSQPRHKIEPLFGFVEFSKIRMEPTKAWITRNSKKLEDKLGSEAESIDLLARNIGTEGVLEPLHVLYEGEVDPSRWRDKSELAKEVPNWNSFTLALGLRRYLAITRAIDKGLLDKDFKLSVRIYLPKEITEKTGETVEHFLTKAAVSSNVFFKGYSVEDKIRITRTLIKQLRKVKSDYKHRDLGYLLGVKASETSSEHRASLRRFAVCDNDKIYRAYTGQDDSGKPDLKRQILTFNVAEHLAMRLGRSPELIDQFLKELNDELQEISKWKKNCRRRDKAPVKLIGYDSSKYCKWIDNLLTYGTTQKSKIAPHSFSYQINSRGSTISIPAIRLDLGDKDDGEVSKVVEVTFKLEKLVESLKKHIEDIRPPSHGGKAIVPQKVEAPQVSYRNGYEDFICSNRLESYSNINAQRKLCNLGPDISTWMTEPDREKHLEENPQPLPANDSVEGDIDEEPSTAEIQISEEDAGQIKLNEWVVNAVVKRNREISNKRFSEKVEFKEKIDQIKEIAELAPLIAGTFAAYSKSLSSFSSLREAFSSIADQVKDIAFRSSYEPIQLTAIETRMQKAIDKIEVVTPDRAIGENIVKQLQDFLNKPPAKPPEAEKKTAPSETPVPSSSDSAQTEPITDAPHSEKIQEQPQTSPASTITVEHKPLTEVEKEEAERLIDRV